jgi:hypothetical protein
MNTSMQFLDDCTAECLTGGKRRSSALRHRTRSNFSVNNVITVVPQVSVGIAISLLGGQSSTSLSNLADIAVSIS